MSWACASPCIVATTDQRPRRRRVRMPDEVPKCLSDLSDSIYVGGVRMADELLRHRDLPLLRDFARSDFAALAFEQPVLVGVGGFVVGVRLRLAVLRDE